MATTLIFTKTTCPPPRGGSLARPHLLARLDAGLAGRLTLVTAPAGFGKSTLLSGWAAASPRPTAWLALDAADAEPARLLAYLIAAVRARAPGFGEALLAALTGWLALPPGPLLAALVNALAGLDQPLALVLDDYHAAASPANDEALAFLIDHLPPTLHLTIASRQVPHLPLAR